MSDLRQCSTCGEMHGQHQSYCMGVQADAVSAAKHRLAEAALGAVDMHVGSEARLTISFREKDDRNDFLLALDDLRRLKGEG